MSEGSGRVCDNNNIVGGMGKGLDDATSNEGGGGSETAVNYVF